MRMPSWRGLATSWLLTAPLAIVIALLEVKLSAPQYPADLPAVLHAVGLHLALALAALVLARILFWRTGAHAFPLIGLAAWLTLEMGTTAAYRLGTLAIMPPFDSPTGKVLRVALTIACLVAGLLAGWQIVRRGKGPLWQRIAGSRAALLGIALALAFTAVASIAVVRGWPRRGHAHVRPEAASLARPDVYILLVDTLRRDHLSFFGYPRPTSPNIDHLLSESYVFSSAYTPSNKTIPSIASLFTGLYPSSHGIIDPFTRIPGEAPTIAEHFRSYGYRTGACVANQIVTGRNGFDQGFDFYFPPSPPWWTRQSRTAIEILVQRLRVPSRAAKGWLINQRFLKWLAEGSRTPRFGYVHYMEPHSPYAPTPEDLAAVAPGAPPGPGTPPFFQRYIQSEDCIDWLCLESPPVLSADALAGMVARYDGEIHLVDRRVGQLIDTLRARGVLDRAHLILASDHGEEFADHRGWFHGHSIYEELTGCALAYRPPGGLAPGRVISRPVSQLDLWATLFTILGMESPPLHQGESIPELLGEPAPSSRRAVVSELPPHLYSLRLGRWKLIQRGPVGAPQLQLFDLAADPREQIDLAGALPDTLALLHDHLTGLIAGRSQTRLGSVQTSIDPRTLERLRSLGYVQ